MCCGWSHPPRAPTCSRPTRQRIDSSGPSGVCCLSHTLFFPSRLSHLRFSRRCFSYLSFPFLRFLFLFLFLPTGRIALLESGQIDNSWSLVGSVIDSAHRDNILNIETRGHRSYHARGPQLLIHLTNKNKRANPDIISAATVSPHAVGDSGAV